MRIKSDIRRTSSLSLAFILLGGLIIYLVKNKPVPRPGEHWSYLAGLFLMTLGTYILFIAEKMTITTNAANKSLLVKRKNLFSKKTEFIPFESVLSVHATRIGRRIGLKTYHLVIHLKDGKKLTPGRWSWNPAEINADALELAREIGCSL